MSRACRTTLVTIIIGGGAFLGVLVAPATAQCEQAKLTASDAAAGQQFGFSVAIDRDYAVVGAAGVAYVFHREGGQWVQQVKLEGTGPTVAISGDWIVIGNTGDDQAAPNAGAAFVFRRNGTNWIQETKLIASDPASDDSFGVPGAIEGDVLVVGATRDDDAGLDAGSVYVFRWSGMVWVEEQELFASDAQPNDHFGRGVAIDSTTIIVGTNQSVSRVTPAQAYVFRWNGSAWVEEQKLVASQPEPKEEFGGSVAISGNVAVVGAGALGSPEDPGGPGSAYVYQFDGTTWVEQTKLTVGDFGFPPDLFGVSVAITGNVLVVGASQGDETGVAGAGTAYLFQRLGGSWTQVAKLSRSDPDSGDFFGNSVALSANYAVIGSRLDDDVCPSDPFCNSGSAYVFSLPGCGVAPIPTVSEWGVVVLTLLVLAVGTIVIRRRRAVRLGNICE